MGWIGVVVALSRSNTRSARARERRASATAVPRVLAAAALARHVHALLLTGHAWHYEMPDPRSLALVRAEHLAEYLAPAA